MGFCGGIGVYLHELDKCQDIGYHIIESGIVSPSDPGPSEKVPSCRWNASGQTEIGAQGETLSLFTTDRASQRNFY